MNPILIVLALSLALNAILGWTALSAHDTATVAKVEETHATGAAVACGKGTEALVTKAADNKAKGAVATASAAKSAQAHDRRADDILASPPAAPGDTCKSAQAVADEWWAHRQGAKP